MAFVGRFSVCLVLSLAGFCCIAASVDATFWWRILVGGLGVALIQSGGRVLK